MEQHTENEGMGDNAERGFIDSPQKFTDNSSNDKDTIKRFSMDGNGKIYSNSSGIAVLSRSTRFYSILGWISAALSALISPIFAVTGIIFGVLVNNEDTGKGNAIIITNMFIAAINIIFGYFIAATIRSMILGYY